jgi:hypothetical protein
MVSFIDVLIHVQCFLTANEFNRLASVNKEYKRELDLGNLPYKDSRFYQRSRELVDYLKSDRYKDGLNPYRFLVHNPKFTHLCTSCNRKMNSSRPGTEESYVSYVEESVNRSGEHTMRESLKLNRTDESGFGTFDVHVTRYGEPRPDGMDQMYLVSQRKTEYFVPPPSRD